MFFCTFTVMNFFRIIGFCLLLVGILSCNKHRVEAPPDLGYDYYPAKLGSYVIYDVDSTVYHQIPNEDTVYYKFQIKERIDSFFKDNQGRATVKLTRFKKMFSPTVPYSQMTWGDPQDVWTANKNASDAEVVEENIRYTKLAFPVKLNTTWNGTAQAYIDPSAPNTYTFTNAVNTFTCTAFDTPTSYGSLSFQKTLTVVQYYSATAIMYQNYYEQYARGVGLSYKEITNYNYQNVSTFTPCHIYEGVHYTMTINYYGIE